MFTSLINSRGMKVASAIMLALFINSSVLVPAAAAAQNQEQQVVLKAGTPIVLETTGTLSSKDITSGSTVDFKVVSDVKAEGVVVIPAGTIAKGQVSTVKKASALGKGGEITVSLNSINAVDGTLVPISGGNTSAVGNDKTALAIICGLFTLIGFIIPGEQAELPAGTQLQAVVMTNSTISLQACSGSFNWLWRSDDDHLVATI